MYIQNNSSFLYSAPDDKSMPAQNKMARSQASDQVPLEHFSEKAILIFERLTAGLAPSQKENARESLASIGKAAAFAATNGFNSQNELNVVSQLYGNLSGVISDEAIQKMIHAKLDNPNFENREFLESFAQELGQPLQGINIKV